MMASSGCWPGCKCGDRTLMLSSEPAACEYWSLTSTKSCPILTTKVSKLYTIQTAKGLMSSWAAVRSSDHCVRYLTTITYCSSWGSSSDLMHLEWRLWNLSPLAHDQKRLHPHGDRNRFDSPWCRPLAAFWLSQPSRQLVFAWTTKASYCDGSLANYHFQCLFEHSKSVTGGRLRLFTSRSTVKILGLFAASLLIVWLQSIF